MVGRCHNKTNDSYPRYGARGIKVCDRWRNAPAAFIEDMGPRPQGSYSIDRFPDNGGNYEPGNCRWATPKEQANNRRVRRLKFDGQELTVREWSEKLGISQFTIFDRLKKKPKWPIRRVLSKTDGRSKEAVL